MKDTSITQEVLHVGILLIIGASVVIAGWNEPLRYLFMSPQQISAEELAMFPEPDESARRTTGLKGTALDRAPYRTLQDGTIEWSNDFDSRKPGPRTETERKENMHNRRR